ncbi:MAG: HD domain-containing protein, partial [Myxococcota bacterium]|nr:HD domain-containing protein [Myxococcota bacterium]
MMTRADLLRAIDSDEGLSRILTLARATLDDDPGHNLDHALRVALWTLRLGGEEIDRREGIAAALLHDLVNLPKDAPDRHLASERSAEAALPHLARAGFDATSRGRIHDAIRDHSFSRGARPSGPLGCALQDADRLEALGAIG